MHDFGGILQVDGYAGYNRLIAPDRTGPSIQRAYCWAHARRKLIEITRTGPAPIAEEGLALIRALYAIEADIRGRDPAARLAARQARAAPILARLARGCSTIAPPPRQKHPWARRWPISPNTATASVAS